MGHALNASIQDAKIRVARMRGQRAMDLRQDHAGIATQRVVEQQLESEGISRHEIGQDAFVERVWEWVEEYGGNIAPASSAKSSAPRWITRTSASRWTQYVRAVTKVFVHLYEKGLIYRDNYMVNWDPGLRTAISDLEVEQRTVEDTLYMVDYPLESGSGSVTIATVRPETMLADTAIAGIPATSATRA